MSSKIILPRGVAIDWEMAALAIQYVNHEAPKSFQHLYQICDRAQLFLATVGRSRVSGGMELLFAGVENSAVDTNVENLQLIKLGAQLSEHGGEITIRSAETYINRGLVTRIMMLSIMSGDDYESTPLAQVVKGHVFREKEFPQIEPHILKILAEKTSGDLILRKDNVLSFLEKTFGPISPAGRASIEAAYGKAPKKRIKAPRRAP